MAIELVEDRPSIVTVGFFAPGLLHPQWFRAQGLLGESEAKHATIKVVHPDVAEWTADDWLIVQVLKNRFMGQALVESRAEALRDLVIGTLQLLDQTGATALGLNRTMHFNVGGVDDYHRVGDVLAPKEPWAKLLPGRLGMRQLQIEQSKREDGLLGKTLVSVAPSPKYPGHVVVDVNNDLVLQQGDTSTSPVDVIREHWPRVFSEARQLAEQLLTSVVKP